MSDFFERTEMVIGRENLEKLRNKHVVVFGVGGVGGYAVEMLARSGIGKLTLVDNDTVSESNLNRQIIALTDSIGRFKTEVFKERISRINPECEVVEKRVFFLPDTEKEIDFSGVDYIIDAIDTVTGKLRIAEISEEKGIPLISAMGTGNKLDVSRLTITDIYKTSVCPLAKVMRHECRKRGIEKLKVVYSTEEPLIKSRIPGSLAFVPAAAGILIASEVIKSFIE